MVEDEKLPPFEQSLAAILLSAKEAVIAPMRTKLRDFDITEPQWRVLRVINDRGTTDATDLAEVALLHAPSVTRILRELEGRALIVRTADPDDRRRSTIALSPAGAQIVTAVSAHVAAMMRVYSARFGATRLDDLAAELRALCAAIDEE
ncbi:homoprotocatechuate degradation regulator HpaR [Sphingobium sp. B2D3A]|uniref:MarR family winged helix-turn-helix transcriptional regulator n=1 Tax=unclassified Sphingobium TaxID=2611147 RepID=UPI00222503D6|nr:MULTISPECIES: MarR family transcriptional regulator [unclassified Sphingobium]MCW2337948.1 homoprotocatechuate degradation regulator HpaR [Sphingobium sp. B2D3A]MCW2384407.1 homoprotocatechuate degradation regulator HpaR [Sphingobium sp. B2D3D]